MARPPVADWFQTHKFCSFRPNETILVRGTELWQDGVGLDIAMAGRGGVVTTADI